MGDALVETQGPLEEINLGTNEKSRITYLNGLLLDKLKLKLKGLLREFKDCFAQDYDEMTSLSQKSYQTQI